MYWHFTIVATILKKDGFKETMCVRASLTGRAPVVANEYYVAMLDKSAFKANVYKYDNAKFPLVGTTADAEVEFSNRVTMDLNSKSDMNC